MEGRNPILPEEEDLTGPNALGQPTDRRPLPSVISQLTDYVFRCYPINRLATDYAKT
jgi:hypothetical protein